ncbi:MAG: 50S ribosomal protein L1 [Myxococcota bacterium]
MARVTKRQKAAREQVQLGVKYPLAEGVGLAKACATARFDESIDIAVRLGVNPRQADQMVRGAISLPHGTGKSVRVIVFAEGDAAKAAEEAGADVVGGVELINRVKDGWVDFDKAIAVRAMMAKGVGRLGPVLGPRGLMPNPKTRTVVANEEVAEAVREVKGGRIDFRVEKAGIVHTPVGKASMEEEKLRDNVLALVNLLLRLKPASAKGTYVKSVAISSTMGPGIRLDAPEVVKLAGEFR